jgi:hypothetical protein
MVLKNMLLNFKTQPDFISFDYNNLPFKRAKRRNCALFVWTIRTEEQRKRMQNYADNIIFEKINPN